MSVKRLIIIKKGYDMTDIDSCRPKWKGTLTDRERFRRQMHYEPVDRCFNMEFGYWLENFTSWPLFRQNNITNNTQADMFFGFDTIKIVRPNVWMDPPFSERIISETTTHKILINTDGILAEVPKDGHDTIPHYLKPTIVTPEDWKRCKAERFQADTPHRKTDIMVSNVSVGPFRREETTFDLDKLFTHISNERDYPLGIHCGSMIGLVRNMLTFEGLAYSVYDYPDMVEDMVETCCVLVERFLDLVLPKMKFDFAAGWEDICFKNGPIVSLDFFERVLVPRYKRIRNKLHTAGVDVWYVDCDGDVRPILHYLLESGINCLFPYEVNCCVHPATLLSEYGKELRLMGGVDKMVLAQGNDAIERYLESLAPLVARGGYIPFCDHRCPPDVQPEYYLYYLDLKERMFGMH